MRYNSVSGPIVLLFLLTFTVGSAFAFDPASGLIVHYEFEDSIADSAGINDGSFYNGNGSGSGNTYEPGPIGNALYLDGSGGVAVPGSVLGDMAGKTMAVWVKIDDDAGNMHFISSAGGDRFYVTRTTWEPGGSHLASNTGPTDVWFGFTPYTVGQWAHVAISVSADASPVSTMYVNGVAGIPASSTDSGVNISGLRLGSYLSTNWVGGLDEFRLYDRVLSASDVHELYNYVRPPTPIALKPSPRNGATNVNTGADLSWEIDPSFEYDGTPAYKVYITTDAGDPQADGATPVDRTVTNYDPGTMPYATEHFWRVDVVDDSNTYRGVPWSFTTSICPIADLTGDCKVNSEDLAVFSWQWLDDTTDWNWSSWCGDLDGDDDVDAADLKKISEEWLKAGDISAGVQTIKPWRRVVQDPVYRGDWTVAGDIDGDGEAEIVAARNEYRISADQYVVSVIAYDLDGTVLWKWGDPSAGRAYCGYDVACQIYDWDNNGTSEVVITTGVGSRRYVVELNGATGLEVRRFEVPADSGDCIAFCNISGAPYAHPKDILVKNRYNRIWAYNYNGIQLWDSGHNPGGYRTAHQARPMDIDNDGIDEISGGCVMFNANGTQRWIVHDGATVYGGHVDAVRLFNPGATAAETRIVITYDSSNRMIMVDGDGNVIWKVTDMHYQSVDVGKVRTDVPGKQLVVDDGAHNAPIQVIDEDGNLLTEFNTSGQWSNRIHRLIDWFGNETEYIVVAGYRKMYDGYGNEVAVFDIPPGDKVQKGDMSGDGVPDIILMSGNTVYIFKNALGRKLPDDVPMGTEVNFTLY